MIFNAPIRSFIRLTLYVLWILAAIPVQAAALLLRLKLAETFPRFVHRVVVRIVGARIVLRGEPVRGGPVLFVANHCSYADISILGSLVRGAFVAKAEVANWPLFGICAKLSDTVFVDRRPRFAQAQAQEMKQRFRRGDRLIMFAEGTTSDGNRVLPFRSSLFGTAEIDVDGNPIMVQPVSLAYTKLDGLPIGRHLRPFFAWYGDMNMFTHLWELMGMGKLEVAVEFHPPVTIRDFANRKGLATYCQAQVAAGMSSSLTGKPQPVLLPAGMSQPALAASVKA